MRVLCWYIFMVPSYMNIIEPLAYRVFSLDITAAMSVSPTNAPGIELYSYANDFFSFG